ncbi:MAG: hypothetical protein Q9213_003908 [Squamulea squamosa]
MADHSKRMRKKAKLERRNSVEQIQEGDGAASIVPGLSSTRSPSPIITSHDGEAVEMSNSGGKRRRHEKRSPHQAST